MEPHTFCKVVVLCISEGHKGLVDESTKELLALYGFAVPATIESRRRPGRPISFTVVDAVLLTLYRLRHGVAYRPASKHFRVAMATFREWYLHTIGCLVCIASEANSDAGRERPLVFPLPVSKQRPMGAVKGRTQLPFVVGAVDGTYTKVRARNSSLDYLNHYGYSGVLTVAVVDCDMRIISLESGWVGNTADSTAFRSTSFYRMMNDDSIRPHFMAGAQMCVYFLFMSSQVELLVTPRFKSHFRG